MALVHLKAGWNATACRSDARSGFRGGGHSTTTERARVTCGQCLENMKELELSPEERRQEAWRNAHDFIQADLEQLVLDCFSGSHIVAREPGKSWTVQVAEDITARLWGLAGLYEGGSIGGTAQTYISDTAFFQASDGRWTLRITDGIHYTMVHYDSTGNIWSREHGGIAKR